MPESPEPADEARHGANGGGTILGNGDQVTATTWSPSRCVGRATACVSDGVLQNDAHRCGPSRERSVPSL